MNSDQLIYLQNQRIDTLVWSAQLGGPEGHFAIVARSLSIPTVVGVKNVLEKLKKNDELIIDGEKGILISNPTQKKLTFIEKKIEEQKNKEKKT